MRYSVEELKQKFIERYEINEAYANEKLIFVPYNSNKMLAVMEFYNYSIDDKNLYLFDCDRIDDLYNKPIAQIKFLDNNNEFYLRRLEFVDNSYKGKGYASKFMDGLTEYCARNNYEYITGELIPLHNEPQEKVEKFYVNNNFKITLDSNGKKHIYKKVLEKLDYKDLEYELTM